MNQTSSVTAALTLILGLIVVWTLYWAMREPIEPGDDGITTVPAKITRTPSSMFRTQFQPQTKAANLAP